MSNSLPHQTPRSTRSRVCRGTQKDALTEGRTEDFILNETWAMGPEAMHDPDRIDVIPRGPQAVSAGFTP